MTRMIGGLGNGSSRSVRLWSCNGSAGNDQTGSSCSGEVEDGTVLYGLEIGNALARRRRERAVDDVA